MTRAERLLNKKEIAHLRKFLYGISMDSIRNMRKLQRDMSKRDGVPEVCWECRAIAKKLGIEE